MKLQTLRRHLIAVSGAIFVVLLLVVITLASRSPHLISALAGGLLLAAGFIVMTPSQLQMAATLSVVVKNMARQRTQQTNSSQVRLAAVLFALGYLVFYLPVALGLGLIAWLLGQYAWILMVVGGLIALILGLAVLGILRSSFLARCRGPLWLVRTGRASFQYPFRAGIAFGQYCASCCGPYVYGLTVLAGATATFWLGSGLVMLYAIIMVIPFLLPILLSPDVYATVSDHLQGLTRHIGRATGYMLVGLGVLLIPVAVLLAER